LICTGKTQTLLKREALVVRSLSPYLDLFCLVIQSGKSDFHSAVKLSVKFSKIIETKESDLLFYLSKFEII